MQPRRQQQQSILSFLHKQSPRRELDPAGDGTTPEKPPRPATGSIAGIMDRLVRPPQPLGRNQDASQVRHVEEQTSPFRNQIPSNGQLSVSSSGLRNSENNSVNLFSEQGLDVTFLHEPPKNSSRSSADEFIRASTLFPELSSNHTPIQEHPNKLSSKSPNNRCIRASSLFEDFDVQTPQNPSKRIFLGPSRVDDTPSTECGSFQILQHSSKKFSLNSANGEYARAVTTFGIDSNDTPTEPAKKLLPRSTDPLYIKPTKLFAEFDSNQTPLQKHSKNFSSAIMDGKHVVAAAGTFPDHDSSPFKPETPAMRIAIPRLKRAQEEQSATPENQCSPLWVLNTMKPAHPFEKKLRDEIAESVGRSDTAEIVEGKWVEIGLQIDMDVRDKRMREVGVSESGIDDAVDKLLARGYKVGRIEQMESADQAKARGSNSVIERKLVTVSTPSTAADNNIGPDAVHLLALKENFQLTTSSNGCRVFGFAFLDYAALKIWVGSLCDDDSLAALGALLVQVSPREVIYETSVNQDAAVCALGGLIGHLTRLMLDNALTNGEIRPYHVYQTCLRMNGQTLMNLEIFRNNFDGGSSGTLYKHLNHCITAFGKRLLRSWICHPLKDVDAINRRLDIVEGFIQNSGLNSTILESLHKIPDLERLLGQVRSTVGLSSTVRLPFVGKKILKRRIKTFRTLIKGLKDGISLLNDLQRGDHGVAALSKVVDIPTLNSLDELISLYEEAIDREFPENQDRPVNDDDHNTLVVLVELFVGKASEWSLVINALSTVDVLRSFAAMTVSSFGSMCRPHVLVKDNVPILRMKGLWHPYAFAESTNSLVPNNLSVGQDLSGTFLVECAETASVLHKATEDSLVLLDELGRGTSTFDGYAIAYAVFRHLVERVRCRLLFATHYHPLTKEFASHPHVSLQHMACMFKPKNGAHGDSVEKELTFLYRLTSGACPESYGLQVATMAGIPKSIVEKASVAGQMMRSKIARNFKSSEERAEFSTLHEEWLRTAMYVCDVKDGKLDDDAMDTAFCISQELKAHFKGAR
ncbi:hypothetical protein PR202_ga23254 [Eleusine coracana subsp. coracana]|uniref:DNA mismatch repair proteins mutS family domain-containing protein n=1 Tax=Eleusine coracana subsp. coracana TaxID=191504 RepID=A0AAV5D669_ELECO|nr:hypothetical protein PR202_ga23254 [Eleusine coracana subsp. coracana]